jgi:MFS family permease
VVQELQPRAFSLMPLVFSVGSMLGPMLGGALANPLKRPSDDHTDGPFLWKYPYALPNIVSASFFLVGISIGILFLRETLNVGRRDYGIILGNKIIAFFKRPVALIKARFFGSTLYTQLPDSPPEEAHSRNESDLELAQSKEEHNVRPAAPSWSESITNQTLIYLSAYTFLAMHNTAFDQIVSVFMHQARTGPDVIPDTSLLRFNKGFGMSKS